MHCREKERVRQIVQISPRLTVLEIGCAADDTILWQVGQTCRALHTLKFGGNEVTDRGVYWMLGGALSEDDLPCPVRFHAEERCQTPGGRSAVCETLQQLDMSRALMVTEEAVSHCWTSCRHLRHFNIQESHLWTILKKIKKSQNWSDFVIPLKRLEITTHCTQVATSHISR